MHKYFTWSIFLISLLLSGCKMNFIVDLYSSDIIETITSTESTSITFPMELEYQISSCDGDENKGIENILSEYFPNFQAKGCRKGGDGFSTFGVANFDVKISKKTNKNSFYLLQFLTSESEDKSEIHVDIVLDQYQLTSLKKRIKDRTFNDIKLSESNIVINLINDRANLSTLITSSFVNFSPIVPETQFDMKKRDKMSIQLSNVATAYLNENNSVRLLTIKGF